MRLAGGQRIGIRRIMIVYSWKKGHDDIVEPLDKKVWSDTIIYVESPADKWTFKKR